VSGSGYISDADLKRLNDAYPERGLCPTCRDTGFYTWKDEKHTCNCMEQKRLNTQYSHAGIGKLYQRLGWDDLKDPSTPTEGLARQTVEDYVAKLDEYVDSGMGLYLWGDMGTGKTLIATLVLKELIKKGYDCYSITFEKTIEQFTKTWGDNEEKELFSKRFIRSRALLLDDLGKEYRNKLSPTTFDNLLRSRVQEERPTLVTTNMKPSEVQSVYGVGALSMLVEQSIEVPLTGADFRPYARTRKQDEIYAGQKRPIQ
jgi:DNA replication protein DnaC